MRQHVIGLTGGIATGKTTIANAIHHHYGLTILDADRYAQEAVALGSPILATIADHYGPDLLQDDGNLNRRQLGQIIFANSTERLWLEAQIHPWVRQRFQEDLPSASNPVIYVVPLLFETDAIALVQETWVVWCSPEEQLKRLMQRNNFDEATARQRILAQMPLELKCDRADLVLDNSGDRERWREQVRDRLG
ncbi:MAG: dephospho-CoA kinase [Oscillatoriales cyanobacterium]|nr:MAG: dephospho-CoA kinase [Oscillatoriales cyanobacterium]